jgi:hypothetical protein
MEIKVTIDGDEAQRSLGQAAAAPAPASAGPQGDEGSTPPAEIAAAAAAIGAIDAGPAHIPPGESGQALPNIAASAQVPAAAQNESALAAGAAPEYGREMEEVIEAKGEVEG